MDPLSIYSLVLDVVDTVTHTIHELYELLAGGMAANATISSILDDLHLTKAALRHLSNLLHTSSFNQSMADRKLDGALRTLLEKFNTSAAYLRSLVDLISVETRLSPSRKAQMIDTWHDAYSMGFFKNQTNILNEMLEEIKSKPPVEQPTLLRKETTKVAPEQSSSLHIHRDRIHSRSASMISEGSDNFSIKFEFDEEIVNSRVYRDALKQNLKTRAGDILKRGPQSANSAKNDLYQGDKSGGAHRQALDAINMPLTPLQREVVYKGQPVRKKSHMLTTSSIADSNKDEEPVDTDDVGRVRGTEASNNEKHMEQNVARISQGYSFEQELLKSEVYRRASQKNRKLSVDSRDKNSELSKTFSTSSLAKGKEQFRLGHDARNKLSKETSSNIGVVDTKDSTSMGPDSGSGAPEFDAELMHETLAEEDIGTAHAESSLGASYSGEDVFTENSPEGNETEITNPEHDPLSRTEDRIEGFPMMPVIQQSLGNSDIDVFSIISNPTDIGSQAPSKRSPEQRKAEELLGILFAQHEQLKPLFEAALKDIPRHRVIANIRRLLKKFSIKLSHRAHTNLEHVTANILKSRLGRTRIAQRIAENSQPEEGDDAMQQTDRLNQVQLDVSRLESWIANNSGFVPPNHPESVPYDVPNDVDDSEASSQSDDEDSMLTELHSAPNLNKMRDFIFQGQVLRGFVMNLRLFLLPSRYATLTRILSSMHPCRVQFSTRNETTLMSSFQLSMERYTVGNWDWWPLSAPKRLLNPEETRIQWQCHCSITQSAVVSNSYADAIYNLLNSKEFVPETRHLCKRLRRRSVRRRFLFGQSAYVKGAQDGKSSPEESGRSLSTRPGLTGSAAGSQNDIHRARLASDSDESQLQSPEPASTRNESTIDITMPQHNLYILFGVKGPRPTLELNHIDCTKHPNDEGMFRALREQHRHFRGFWRYWFSVWRFRYCDFVKFEKIRARRIISRGQELPTDVDYEYTPRPPSAPIPPISPHEFEIALSCCPERCKLSSLHECIEPAWGDFALVSTPKKKGVFAIGANAREFAWGLQAVHSISFIYMLVYHAVMLSWALGLWVWWERRHPGDLQNAAVPITTVAVLLSLFWGSAGVLKGLEVTT